jgi:hypothetical protein
VGDGAQGVEARHRKLVVAGQVGAEIRADRRVVAAELVRREHLVRHVNPDGRDPDLSAGLVLEGPVHHEL